MHKQFILALAAATTLSACANNPYTGESANTAKGATIGAAGGALLGNVVAGSGHRTTGTLLGAAIGATVGGLVGHNMDQQEAQLRQQMASSGVSVDRQGDTIHLQAPEAITFTSGRADLKPAFYPVLDKLADSLRQYPDTVVQIEGHTDSSGSASQNQMLSENRANNVRSNLMQRGIPGSRLVAVGYGASRPLASNDTASGRAQNRRVEILIVPRQ